MPTLGSDSLHLRPGVHLYERLDDPKTLLGGRYLHGDKESDHAFIAVRQYGKTKRFTKLEASSRRRSAAAPPGHVKRLAALASSGRRGLDLRPLEAAQTGDGCGGSGVGHREDGGAGRDAAAREQHAAWRLMHLLSARRVLTDGEGPGEGPSRRRDGGVPDLVEQHTRQLVEATRGWELQALPIRSQPLVAWRGQQLPSRSCRVRFTALSASAELRRGGGGATITTGSSPSARHPRRPVPVSILSGSSARGASRDTVLFASISTRSAYLRMRVVGAGVRPSQQTASEPAPQMCVPTVVDLARCSARSGRRAGGGLGSGLP
eukprot:scaffold3899_cov68-Phaeocystis_antarctica.AAC.1